MTDGHILNVEKIRFYQHKETFSMNLFKFFNKCKQVNVQVKLSNNKVIRKKYTN